MSKYNPRRRAPKPRNSAAGPNGPARVMWTVIDEEAPELWMGAYMTQESAEQGAELLYRRRARPIRIVRLRCTEDVSMPYEHAGATPDDLQIQSLADELGLDPDDFEVE